MPRKSTSAKPAAMKQTQPMSTSNTKKRGVTRKSRKPRGQTQAEILKGLADGPKTSQELIKAAGLSPASFYLHIGRLRAEKKITGGGRGQPFHLIHTTGAPTPTSPIQKLPAVRRSPTTTVLSQYVSGPLQDAIEAVSARFMAPADIGEKLHTLDQLANTLPEPISLVLRSIQEDLLRLSPGKSPK